MYRLLQKRKVFSNQIHIVCSFTCRLLIVRSHSQSLRIYFQYLLSALRQRIQQPLIEDRSQRFQLNTLYNIPGKGVC